MTMRVDVPADAIAADLRATGRQIRTALRRAITDALRRSQTVARRAAREETGLKAGAVNRRIRAYPRSGTLWMGAYPASVTSVSRAGGLRLRAPRRAGVRGRGPGGTGRAIIYRGRRMPRAFVPRSTRYGRQGFRRRADGRLERVAIPISAALGRIYRDMQTELPAIYDVAFEAAIERTAR